MTIRVIETSDSRGSILQLDGRLEVEDAPELIRAINRLRGAWTLEVANLLSADSDGIELLLGLRSTGIPIHGASPYLELLLESHAERNAAPKPQSWI